MAGRSRRSPKAYKNLEFLNSPAARPIRMLSEFIEPRHRFGREGIRDTIVVFGSARIKAPDVAKKNFETLRKKAKGGRDSSVLREAEREVRMSEFYRDAVKLSYLLTKWSRSLPGGKRYVICSGGGPGIMEAANRGAMKAGGPTIGLNISLPFEQESNRYISTKLNLEFHYFFMRKFWFVYLAKALIVFPGGFGTMDEMMEVLTLVQTKKVKKKVAILLYGRSYWDEVLNMDALVKHGMVSKRDLKLFRYADTPDEAFRYLKTTLRILHG